MSLTQLQQATLSQLGVSRWERNEDFHWQQSAPKLEAPIESSVTAEAELTDRTSSIPQTTDISPEVIAENVQEAPPIIECQLAISADDWMRLEEKAQLDVQKLLVDLDIEMTMMTEAEERYQASVAKISGVGHTAAEVKKSLWMALGQQ